MAAELSWTPQVPFESGITESIAWYREHRAWWEPLRRRALVAESQWKR
ncbi:MAG: hypothetical protein AB1505_29895 [Candidatus Latescibacterota bacterium]